MIKKITLTALILLLLLSLFGCGKIVNIFKKVEEIPTDTTEAESKEGTTSNSDDKRIDVSGFGNGKDKKETNDTAVESDITEPDGSTVIVTDITEEYEYVSARLYGNTLTVTILPEYKDEYPWIDSGIFGKTFTVIGTDNSYIDMHIGTMGQYICPYIFLLTEKCNVECIPIGEQIVGSDAATLSFTNMGEMPRISNIITFYDEVGGDAYSGAYMTVFAVDSDNNRHDLSASAYYMEHPEEIPPSIDTAMNALRGYLPKGMSMLDSLGTEFIYDELCTLISMGTKHDEQFVREQTYAVSSTGAIYFYDIMAEADENSPIGYDGEIIPWESVNTLARIYSEIDSEHCPFVVITDPDGTEFDDMPDLRTTDIKTSIDSKSSIPLLFIPLQNNMNLKVEIVEPDGSDNATEVCDELTVSRGEVCRIHTPMKKGESPLRITATWKYDSVDYSSTWYASYDSEGLPYKQYGFAVESQQTQTAEVNIIDMFSYDGSFKDKSGNEYPYYYHVPQFDADTSDAAFINGDIFSYYSDTVNGNMNTIFGSDVIDDVNDIDIISIEWESYKNGNILTIIIKSNYTSGYCGYKVYNYDTQKGIRLYDDDILVLKDIGTEEYLNALRWASAKCFDELYLNKYAAESPETYLEKRLWTISEANIQMGRAWIYLDENGSVSAITHIASFDDAESFDDVVTLDFDNTSAVDKQVQLKDYFNVSYRNCEMSISFLNTSKTKQLLSDLGYSGQIIYGVKQPVNGIYSEYKDIICGMIPGTPSKPYVFMLTSDGRVEYIDVMNGMMGGYLCAGAPLPLSENIISLKSVKNSDGEETVEAVDSNGKATDIAPILNQRQETICFKAKNEWVYDMLCEPEGGGDYINRYILRNNSADNITLRNVVIDGDVDYTYKGSFTHIGMTENGAIYYYRLRSITDSSDLVYEGAAAFSRQFVYSSDKSMYKLIVMEVSDTGFVDLGIGSISEFEEH